VANTTGSTTNVTPKATNVAGWANLTFVIPADHDEFEGEKTFERGIGFYDYWEHDYPVDFLCYTIAEFNRLKKKATIVKEAMKEGIEIK